MVSDSVRFDGRVAVITGAGGGLGRAYALLLASRGAKVVVNDLGAARGGEGASSKAADLVVAEINKAGGTAIPNYDSVTHGQSIIDTAINSFGRIDILINNAGNLRDVSFGKMSEKDWDMIMEVHMKGSFSCTKAAWPHMLAQNYGRVINTASGAGLYGNFGQANYSSAKLGLLGFTKSLAAEGSRKNVLVNCIAPLAATRMTESLLPKEVFDALRPETIAPFVAFLSSEVNKENGEIYELGGGWIAKLRWQRAVGHSFPSKGEIPFTPEDVLKHIGKISDFSQVTYPSSLQESIMMATQSIGSENKLEEAKPSAAVDRENVADAKQKTADAAASAEVSKEVSSLKCWPYVDFIRKYIEAGKSKELVTKVGYVYGFDITKKKGATPVSFTIDLKNGHGHLKVGRPEKFDAYFTMNDNDFTAVLLGSLNPQIAFMRGKMKIKGSMKAAMKFTPDLFPKPSKM